MIETSSTSGGLGLLEEKILIGKREWTRSPKQKRQSHSEIITKELESLLSESSRSFEQLSGLIVTVGPGSFTGIRVGLNHAKTLSYALNLPIFAFNSLEALASSSNLTGPVCTITNAFRNMVYFAIYQNDGSSITEIEPPQALNLEQMEAKMTSPINVIGDGLKVYAEVFSENLKSQFLTTEQDLEISMAGLARLFELRRSDSSTLSWKSLMPLYLRPSSAEENREMGILKPLIKLD